MDGGVGVGDVEGAQDARHILAVEAGVERAPVERTLRQRVHAGPAATGQIERAGGHEQAVAPGLPIEPAPVGASIELVVGIALGQRGADGAGLPPCPAGHNLPVQPAQAPVPLLDKPAGEIVEQFGMAGGLAAQAEIASGIDEAAAEVVGPHPVDDQPGRERVVGRGDTAGQFQPPAGLPVGRCAAEQLGQPALHDLPRPAGIAPQQDRAVDQRAGIQQHHRVLGASQSLHLMLRDSLLQPAAFNPFLDRGQLHRFRPRHHNRRSLFPQHFPQGDQFGRIAGLRLWSTRPRGRHPHHQPGIGLGHIAQGCRHRRADLVAHQRIDGFGRGRVAPRGHEGGHRGGDLGIGPGAQGNPGPQKRVGGIAPLTQPSGAVEQDLREVVAVGETGRAVVGLAGRGTGRFKKIVGRMTHRCVCAAEIDILLVDRNRRFELGEFFRIRRRLGPRLGCHNHRQFARHVAAGKDAVEGIVIGGADRLVFMIVAAGTGDAEPHQPACHQIDAIVDDVVLVAEKRAPHGEKSQRRQIGGGHGGLEPVGRQLQH